MAEGASDSEEKTEEPTGRRLEKAREDGQIASSKELFVFTTLAAGVLIYLGLLTVVPEILQLWRELFRFDGREDLMAEAVRIGTAGFVFVFVGGLALALPIGLVVIATQSAMDGGVNWAASAMAFKGSRIDPLAGLKRMVSVKALVELVKSVLKVVLLLGATGLVLISELPALVEAQSAVLGQGLARFGASFLRLMVALLLVLAVIAVLDVIWQQYDHRQTLRMTRQEVRDEHKQTEGSPEVKAKIRRMQMTAASRAARRREAMTRIPEATAIITNPTHFAVALKYEVGGQGAPIVIVSGRGLMAQEIIERGREARVTIFRNELLARALFFSGEIGQEIPGPLFTAVAAVLAFIYRVGNGEDLLPPEVDVPEDMRFDEMGRRMDG